jgi:hypothetical protein
VPDVVEEPGREEKSAAAEDSAELAAPLHCPDEQRKSGGRGEPGEDPDAAEGRRRLLVPALPARVGDETSAERRAEDDPENRERDG